MINIIIIMKTSSKCCTLYNLHSAATWRRWHNDKNIHTFYNIHSAATWRRWHNDKTYILCTTYTVQQHDVDDTTTRHTCFVQHTQCSNMTSMTQRQESLIRAKPGHRVHLALEKLMMRSQSGHDNVVQKNVMSKKNSFKYLIDINNISNPL